MKLEILPVYGIGDVAPGDDLASLVATAAPWLRDGDVVVVTSKIVSKAEGQLVDVPGDGALRAVVREELLVAETARPVARRGQTRIVQTHHGFVMASAGIDSSNVDHSRLVLLPKDPDASARSLRSALRERHGVDVAVVVSDTMGRPWRNGLTDVALGAAGIDAIRDHRGEVDPYGNKLHITQMAVVDELAAAAELVKGKCDRVPVAVVRGYLPEDVVGADGAGAVPALVRAADQDLFSMGTAEARAAGLRAAALLPDRPAAAGADARGVPVPVADADGRTPEAAVADRDGADVRTGVWRAVAAVSGAVAPGTALEPSDGAIVCRPPATTPAALVRFGADVHRVRAALAAEGLPTTLTLDADGGGTLYL
jgi:coenzyme F420-0:L-glutamate ligase/coenzyme F420-1:gamma-L-glutamate ligase